MIREDKSANFFVGEDTSGPFGSLFPEERYYFSAGGIQVDFTKDQIDPAGEIQRTQPVPVTRTERRQWWWFEDRFHWTDESYSPTDAVALVRDRERRERRKVERARANLDAEQAGRGNHRRQSIPEEVRRTVFTRDGGRCVQCGSNFDLQYDHVIPVALGRATSVENLQVLCRPCIQRKSNSL